MMKIKMFADTICGWCYIGHSRLLKAAKTFKNIAFDFEHAPFQLNPNMPKEGMNRLDYLEPLVFSLLQNDLFKEN